MTSCAGRYAPSAGKGSAGCTCCAAWTRWTGAVIVRERLLTDYRDRTGPFDVIGDVHGCRGELEALLGQLGYEIPGTRLAGRGRGAPAARTAVFLGDLVDRGPGLAGRAPAGDGHGRQRARPGRARQPRGQAGPALSGTNVSGQSRAGRDPGPAGRGAAEFRAQVSEFCRGLVSHLVLDGGQLVVAHAGLRRPTRAGRPRRVRSFALYGDTTGETDEFGLPSATRGPPTTGARPWCSTGTPRCRSRNGSTTRCAWTPGACSAVR